jgi:hypothetical protein
VITGANHLLLAPTRSGKTHFAFNELFLKAPLGIFVDPKNTDDYIRAAARRLDVNSVEQVEFLASMVPQNYIILHGSLRNDIVAEAAKLITWALNLKLMNPGFPPITIAADECWRFMSKWQNNVAPLQRAVCEGRGYGISTILIAQHPRVIPNDLIENATYVYTWPAVDELGVSQGLHPIIVQYFFDHSYPEIPPDCVEWCKKPYHGLRGDLGGWAKIAPNGTISKSGQAEVKHDETPSQPVAPGGTVQPVDEEREANPPGVDSGGSSGQGTDQNWVLKP